jgi:hypothetical protein
MPLDETVDEALRGRMKPPQLRLRGEDGHIVSRIDTSAPPPPSFEPTPFGPASSRRRSRERRRRGFDVEEYMAQRERTSREPGWDGGPAHGSARSMQPLAVFPYGVSRSYLEQSVRELQVPVRIQHNVDDADMVLTLKNYYRRKDSPVRSAEATGIPIQVLRSNTVAQIKGALARVYGVEEIDPTETALEEAMEGVERARQTTSDVELAPQNSYVRRLQHQLVERHDMSARSTGNEPNRRLVILAAEE